MKKHDASQAFTVVILCILSLVFMVAIFFNMTDKWLLNSWGSTMVMCMTLYLAFIVARAGFLLMLSFSEKISQKNRDELKYYPLVSIIVPCFNEDKVLDEALKSILNINYPNLDIIVVDDGSLDLTLSKAKDFEKKFKLRVIHKENAGKAEALNRGIEEALGDYYLCMDADSVLSENVIVDALKFFQQDSTLAAVAGSVKVGNARNLLTAFQKLEYIIGLNFHKMAQSYLNCVTIVPGPIGLFKKSAVQDIGGYDSGTFAEDADLSMRLLLAGHGIKYCPDIVAVTEAPEDFNSLMTQRYRWSRGMIQAIRKNANAFTFRNFNFRNFFITSYMFLETVAIPVINFVFAFLTLHYALSYGTHQLMGSFFLGLILLDMTLSLYSITSEKKISFLFCLSLINRVTYGFSLEVLRFYAIFDELFKIPMKWGTLERKGID